MASENESLKVGDREAFEKWMNREPTWVDYNSDARYMAWEAALEYERSRHRIPPAQAEPARPTYAEVTNWPPGAVADITAALDREVEEAEAEVKEWVPVADEVVLIEAVFVRHIDGDSIDGRKWVAAKVVNDMGIAIVPLTALRPLPVAQEEGAS